MGRGRVSGEATPSQWQGVETALPAGEDLGTPHGKAYLIQEIYPAKHLHGRRRLHDLRAIDMSLAAEVVSDQALRGAKLEDLVFLDTETTGLVGGAGTLVFMVGVGAFVKDGFRLRQYFLRDPAKEDAMLYALQGDLDPAAGLVTFNGKIFDVPLLEMRYMLGLRQRWSLTSFPQIDLLYPARRLWRRVLPDCSLGTIERSVLGVRRTEEDVPGHEIPGLYQDFLRTGDASGMARVAYHNAVDILSLVVLTTEVLSRHDQATLASLMDGEALGVARWHQSGGRLKKAELAYQEALSHADSDTRLEALRRYSFFLKREGRHEEAVAGWKEWYQLAPDNPLPCIELAKYFEWHARDLAQASYWAENALEAISHWPEGWRRDREMKATEHRLARLARKTVEGE